MTLLEPDGELPPVLPPGTYKHNKADKIIRINGGGIIQYFGMDDPAKKGSYSGTGVAIDEAVDMTEKDLKYLSGRMSIEVEGVVQQMYMACNPGAPTHPLAEEYGLRPGTTIRPGREVIQTNVFENRFLGKEYLDDLRTWTGVYADRYVWGKWVANEGAIFDNFDLSIHPVDRDTTTWPRRIVSVDDGTKHPFAVTRIAHDGDRKHHVEATHRESGMQMEHRVAVVKRLFEERPCEVVLVDPSAALLKLELAKAGLPVMDANNDVNAGIDCVRQLLEPDQFGGGPDLTFARELLELQGEMGGYTWYTPRGGTMTSDKERPIKEKDDLVDALRYGCMYFSSPPVQVYG